MFSAGYWRYGAVGWTRVWAHVDCSIPPVFLSHPSAPRSLSRSMLLVAAGLTAVLLPAQTATQILLINPSSGDGTPFSVDTTGRHQSNHNLSRSVEHNGNIAEATNTTSWDLNPAAGSMQVSSQSRYQGWVGSGVTLDTRYALGLFDTFTINAGNSGFSIGDNVQLTLALTIQVSAQTDGLNAQTAGNWLTFTVQQRDPVPDSFGTTHSDELLSLEYQVGVYDFTEKAILNGVTQFDNTVTYVNGQGNEADVYQFDITLNGVVGETLELGMMFGDFNPNVYDYTIDNFITGTRQDIGNSQADYGNQFSAQVNWDLEEVLGFEGLEVLAASGFAPGISAVPEPSSYALLMGLAGVGFCATRRRRRIS